MYSVRSVQLYGNVVVENVDLVTAICVKLLQLQRYGFECVIYDEYGYLVPLYEQNAALEAVQDAARQPHPLRGKI